MTQLSDPGALKDALLTMDVVDEIRHRDAELTALADSGLNDAGLKDRLIALYKSQGIEVSEQVIEQGIAAQRDRRFVYQRPTGWKAWLAGRWINRAAIGKRAAVSILAVACAWALTFLVVIRPLENRAQALVISLNGAVDGLPAQVEKAHDAYKAEAATLQAQLARAGHVPNSDRLANIVLTGTAVLDERGTVVANAIKSARDVKVPRLQRVNGVTHVIGATATGDEATGMTTAAVLSVETILQQVDVATRAVKAAAANVMSGADASVLLDNSNSAALKLSLPTDADRYRQREYAAGDAALRASNPPQARAAAARIDQIGPNVAKLATIDARLAKLRDEAAATGASGVDKATVDGDLDKVRALARIETAEQAEQALKVAEGKVELLAAEYTYRVVNRVGTKSGVWRYSNDNPGTRNHYLVVEAIDANGSAATLPIRNEETGNTEDVSLFAVRVPEAEYERVGADKRDNGIIEKDVVGRKARGHLAPHFDIPTAGGFITSW